MRHGCKVNKLSRTHAHRAAMLSNMASSLILHKRIETTLAKAKALRGYVEPLINRTKADSTHQRRMVFSYLQNKEAVKELFGDVATKVANRPGGYTRILKLGRRMGDGAEMVMMELVDYNEAMLKETATKKAKTTRRGGKKKATETVEAPVAETATEEPKAE
ncbi:MAG: 50S ribosomal protein L17 [Bacteroidales bacterium]|nr:50S ribosomal protein L17 [Bacteroidales bacterium]